VSFYICRNAQNGGRFSFSNVVSSTAPLEALIHGTRVLIALIKVSDFFHGSPGVECGRFVESGNNCKDIGPQCIDAGPVRQAFRIEAEFQVSDYCTGSRRIPHHQLNDQDLLGRFTCTSDGTAFPRRLTTHVLQLYWTSYAAIKDALAFVDINQLASDFGISKDDDKIDPALAIILDAVMLGYGFVMGPMWNKGKPHSSNMLKTPRD
jgi:hypothetical protein